MPFGPLYKHRLLIARRIAAKYSNKLFGKLNTVLQPRSLFSIKAGYHHAKTVEDHDARGSTDEWQPSVYKLAESAARQMTSPTILDVGCGSGFKLVERLGNYPTTGIEVDPTYTWLKQKYPDRNWLLFDTVLPETLKADIVICCDVIEHIKNPDDMMRFLAAIDFQLLILSTPERDRVAGRNDFGPPRNTAHYREWNQPEFHDYVSKWFVIREHPVFNDRSITQVTVCSKQA
jgi:2-polyprenyl-3-methyl-5-hydroxy-6-metoxy-1,4-benzoquinol methylase